jgi:hypothetical protein
VWPKVIVPEDAAIVSGAGAIVTCCCTTAERKPTLPLAVASITQVPTPVNVTALPENPHTPDADDESIENTGGTTLVGEIVAEGV